EGNRLARAGDVVNATDKFAEAVTLSPELTIKPELEAIRIAALANKQAGERLAQAGEVISATLKFEAAMALDPFLAIEPEPEARRLAALAFLDQAWTDENERSKARELLDELTEQMPSLTVGSPVTATTASIPYWHFTGTVGQMVMISLVYTEDGQFDPPLKLYDANGNILSEGDADPKVSNGYDAFIEAFTLPETGTYFVKAGRPDSSAVYELMVLSESTEAGTE
ncbi:MAG: PPC domain-containing protein, partial [Chloroflexota bacterium]